MKQTTLRRGSAGVPARFWDLKVETDTKVIEQLVKEGYYIAAVEEGTTT